MEWIDIKHKKPTVGQYCITYFPCSYMQSIEIGRFIGEGEFDYGDDFIRFDGVVKYWMPLPDVPGV